MKVLYKYSTNGKAQQWEIIVDGDKFYTVEGQVDGKLTTSLPTLCKGKNIGRANETTANEQAIKEAQAKWDKKIAGGYNETLTKGSKFFEPMLAQKFEKGNIDFKKQRVFVQPKLDGIRCINDAGTLMSRLGKPFTTCPHLYQTGYQLDGELYNHELKEEFNEIVSLVKRKDSTEAELAETKKMVQYWIYDFPEISGKFSQRLGALNMFFKTNTNPSFKQVPTYEVFSDQDIDKYNDQFLDDGYEGTIVRLDTGDYECKRSKQLLKYKAWIDEEFEIIGYEEGNGGRVGTIGKFWMKHDKDRRNDFKCNVKGPFSYLREIWENKESYIGVSGTVKYFNRTPIGDDGLGDKPRFGYIIKFDRESYE